MEIAPSSPFQPDPARRSWLLPCSGFSRSLIELAVLSTLWSNLSASGDAERYGPGCPCDPDALNDTEPDADVREEA